MPRTGCGPLGGNLAGVTGSCVLLSLLMLRVGGAVRAGGSCYDRGCKPTEVPAKESASNMQPERDYKFSWATAQPTPLTPVPRGPGGPRVGGGRETNTAGRGGKAAAPLPTPRPPARGPLAGGRKTCFEAKSDMGLDIRVILLGPACVTKRGWESFYYDSDQRVMGPALELPRGWEAQL